MSELANPKLANPGDFHQRQQASPDRIRNGNVLLGVSSKNPARNKIHRTGFVGDYVFDAVLLHQSTDHASRHGFNERAIHSEFLYCSGARYRTCRGICDIGGILPGIVPGLAASL